MAKNRQTIVAVMDDGGSVASALEAHGAITLDIDRFDEIKEAIDHVDGVVLTGGGDIKPEKYGAVDKHPRVYGNSFIRDRREFWAAKEARKRGIPLMGICRGHQMINVASGGSLYQHLPDLKSSSDHRGGRHPVIYNIASQVGVSLGGDGTIDEVVTLHHQGIDRMGDGLVPVGWAPDGTVEMIESAPGIKGYVLGCQFHPEMNWASDDDSFFIFMHYMRQVVRHASGKKRARDRLKPVKHLEWDEKARSRRISSNSHQWSGDSWPPSEATGWTRTQYGGWIRKEQTNDPKAPATVTPIGKAPSSPQKTVLATSDDDDEAGLQAWLREKEATCSADPGDYTEVGDTYTPPAHVTVDGRRVPFWADNGDIADLDENICGSPPCQAVEDCLLWGDCAAKAIANVAYHPGSGLVKVSDITQIQKIVDVAKGKRGNPRKGGGNK